ncbi:HEPATOMA-DERIVED GROWTH FACTOR-RELATED [Ceraceosorus bombacis]|uniref:HEPATOMA-DERIVED GROWTH FACTOR-RELATED n=1 Tax=Ceraceosorus bombacis TaxID=401625 RepID=A0A0P1BF33_9BASI|nr:HEPATOMA-DERIVED GROWTH FACTOR-RELATED [Ceraceosorus bombacis]
MRLPNKVSWSHTRHSSSSARSIFMTMPSSKPREDKTFNAGDVVMAKVKGYPPWPGIVVDEKNVPTSVNKQKPGKGVYTVRFFPQADYNWFKGYEMNHLTPKEIKAFLDEPSRAKADLRQAFLIAQDPSDWNDEQNVIVKNAEEAALEFAEGQDELAEDEDDDTITAKRGGKDKRKREEKKGGKIRESAESKAKKQKKGDDEKERAASARKSAAGDEESVAQDPETKMVYGWRHALQRGFLPKDGIIKEDETPNFDKTFKSVESYTDITEEQLRETKIGKVMKRIALLTDIPKNDEFNFAGRAQALCQKWGDVMAGGGGETKQDEAAAEAS